MKLSKRTLSVFSLILIPLILLVMGSVGSLVQAQGNVTPTLRPVSDDEVNRVARNLYCPVCQNVPLEVCETAACADWREQVRTLLAQGYTEEQVRQYFVNRFGTKTVGMPQDTVSQLLTILLPFGVIAVIGIVIGFNLLVWRRNRVKQQIIEDEKMGIADEEAPSQDDYRARLEAELKERS